jgi:outer membrane protein assembly factor BamD (BamD/ComL family)
MAKQRRPTSRAVASKSAAKRRTTAKTTKGRAKPKTVAQRKTPAARKRRPERAPVVTIREAYNRAVTLYEKGLKALQRKHYDGAATAFRQVLEQYPEERELHERARLYLNVCERETRPQAKTPRSVDERILAATVALNRRDVDEALSLLGRGSSSHRTHDHIQYMLALAHALRDDIETAVEHLTRAIALNPNNRLQAKQEPDFDSIRGTQLFLDAVKRP